MRLSVATAAVMMLAGCGPSFDRPPTIPGDDGFADPERVVPAGVDNDTPPPDVLMAGDIVDLNVLSTTNAKSAGLIVGADGTIPVGPAGYVAVAGLSLADAAKRVQEAMRKFDKFATPTLSLVRPDGRRVTVVGSVERPGVHTAAVGLRVADAVALSGGPKAAYHEGDVFLDADLEAARVVRAGEVMPVSVTLAMQGDPRHNIFIHPGDLLWVPSLVGKRVSVLGDVKQPASLRYRAGIRLTEALADAGGATEDADQADVRIIRGPLSKPRVYRASLDDIVDGRVSDVVLAPGDVVFVTEHWFASATDVLRRLSPLLIAVGIGFAIAQ